MTADQQAARDAVLALRQRLAASVLGQDALVDRLLMALLANGNVLLEGLPGLAKTRAVKSLARALDARFSRLQFTPDLLPSDVTGTEILHTHEGETHFRFAPGPVFANLVLVDEINRAPAKVQSALLEVMEERQVTVAGVSHPLPSVFLVLATQNPLEQEGTYPLPEAQLDRFLLHVLLDYPDPQTEAQIIQLVRAEEAGEARPAAAAAPPVDVSLVTAARQGIARIHVAPLVEQYIVDLVNATRRPAALDAELGRWLRVGASVRASLALDRCARVQAWLEGREQVLPQDVRAVAPDCLRHRILLSYEALADGIDAEQVVQALLARVAIA